LKTGNQIFEFWNSYACIAEENLARTNSGRERRALNTVITLCIC